MILVEGYHPGRRRDPVCERSPARQTRQELSELKQQVQEVASGVKVVDTHLGEEARMSKQMGQESAVALDSLRNQFSTQRSQLSMNQQKIENAMKLVSMEAQEREALAQSVKQAFDASLQTLHEQNKQNIQMEINRRNQLAQDIVEAFKRLRAEVAAGFQQANDAQSESEKLLKSLESILRAEIRSRIDTADAHAKQLARLDKRTAGDTQMLVKGLKEVDQVLSETRGTLSSEYRAQLEQLAGRVCEIQESLTATNAALKDVMARQSAHQQATVVQSDQSKKALDDAVGAVHGDMADRQDELQDNLAKATASIQKTMKDCNAVRAQLTELEKRSEKAGGDVVANVQKSLAALKADTEAAVGTLREEIVETLELGATERGRIVAQMKEGMEYERQQWETAMESLQSDLHNKAKHDREAMGRIRTELRDIKSGDVSFRHDAPGAALLPGAPRSPEPLHENVSELYDLMHALRKEHTSLQKRLEAQQQQQVWTKQQQQHTPAPPPLPAPPASTPPPRPHSEGDDGGHRRRPPPHGGEDATGLASVLREIELLKAWHRELGGVQDGMKDEHAALAGAHRELAGQVEGVRGAVGGNAGHSAEALADLQHQLHHLRTHTFTDYQLQLDEIRGNVLLNADEGMKKRAGLQRIFEDQVRGCLKAHTEHERQRCALEKDLAQVKGAAKALERRVDLHEAVLSELKVAP
eukprot:TRINITY_DN156_c0_g4_i2.p1 TRINITY_DN156_c0_g4~~TRINITY_DN156_c0_g4_i2.p1  ORF type:complete len:699 (+),score=279.77 TRINITY_DN156_c0_g4_i2:451-2547(+)